jgi:predicted nucleic acid-binding protein
VIALDASVCMKWFKGGERYEAEAQELRGRIAHQEIAAIANEILSLEIVRGLKNAQSRQPASGITNDDIEDAFRAVEGMFQTGILLECPVSEAKPQAKEIEIVLGLFMADAIHLATAVHLGADFLVVDDHHFLTAHVVNYAANRGVRVVDLPGLIVALPPP